jgi:hypothetical protein
MCPTVESQSFVHRSGSDGVHLGFLHQKTRSLRGYLERYKNKSDVAVACPVSLFIMRWSDRPRHCDGRRFVRGQESFDQRRATQERNPLLAQGPQQLDPAGIRKRQTLQIETYSVAGSSRRNDLPRFLDPCTE